MESQREKGASHAETADDLHCRRFPDRRHLRGFSSPSTLCFDHMEQTSQKLNLSVDVIKAKGALVIGGEKVQDVSDGARKVGEHLTACCQTQHSEPPLPPDQYLGCVNGAKNYEAKIVQVSSL